MNSIPDTGLTPQQKREAVVAALRYQRDYMNAVKIPALQPFCEALNAVSLTADNPNLPTQLAAVLGTPLSATMQAARDYIAAIPIPDQPTLPPEAT